MYVGRGFWQRVGDDTRSSCLNSATSNDRGLATKVGQEQHPNYVVSDLLFAILQRLGQDPDRFVDVLVLDGHLDEHAIGDA